MTYYLSGTPSETSYGAGASFRTYESADSFSSRKGDGDESPPSILSGPSQTPNQAFPQPAALHPHPTHPPAGKTPTPQWRARESPQAVARPGPLQAATPQAVARPLPPQTGAQPGFATAGDSGAAVGRPSNRPSSSSQVCILACFLLDCINHCKVWICRTSFSVTPRHSCVH